MLKFFANVVTFGAIAKVEASRDCFNYAKSDYESKLNQYEMALKNYESNKAKLDVLLSELKSHKKSLIKNNGTYAMKHLEKNGNEILSLITKNIPLKLENVSALAVYEGQIDPADNFNNFDSIAATLIMGPFGIIGAHGSADETVEENNKRNH